MTSTSEPDDEPTVEQPEEHVEEVADLKREREQRYALLEERNEALQARVERLEAVVEEQLEAPEGLANALGELGLSRRQVIYALGMVAAGASVGVAVTDAISEPALADAQGEIGTATDPLSALYTDAINDGGPIYDGGGTERSIYVIANGASDPAGAGPEDIILEEES